MEQAREVKDHGQAVAWVEAEVARADVAVDKGEEVVLRQDRAVIASAPSVVKEQPINWDSLVMSSNVLNAAAR